MAALMGLLSACSPITLLNLAISREGYHIERNLAYGPDPRQKLDLYVPDHLAANAPVILFFYGGSWQTGSKKDYLAFGQAFASEGIMVAIADYRLYPQVRYPAFVQDGASAFVYVHANIQRYGGDPKRIFLAGHSAGAYIAVMLAADETYLRDAGADPAWIRGVIGIAGPYDFLPLKDKDLIAIFDGDNRQDTQPIYYIDGKRPPMFLATGADDTIVGPKNTFRLTEKLRAFSSPVEEKTYPGVGHISIIVSLVPGFRGMTTLRKDMIQFVRTH
jgi:acetyl esterase/lipase